MNTESARSSWIFVLIYLGAIVIANLVIAAYGPAMANVVAFFLIALDLTSRDRLHELWRGRRIIRNMGLLIGAGSVITWALNWNAGPVALASFLAFSAAAVSDTVIYHILRDRQYLVKVNGSNLISAGIDSAVFLLIAFQAPWYLIATQWIAKLAGGFVWSLLLRPRHK